MHSVARVHFRCHKPRGATRIETHRSRPELLSCSVVICTRNRPEQLDACVAAVLAQRYPSFDVLIVDNASDDRRSFEVAARYGVRCVSEPAVGLSHARNRGARESATSEVVAYIDDDAVPEAEWLQCLCAEFADPRVMCVVGRILPLEPETEGSRMCVAMGILDGGPRPFAVDNDHRDWFDAMRSGLRGAANMAVSREAFSLWPGFDPRLGLGTVLRGGEEDYAYLSLIRRGYRVAYTPSAVVRHPFPQTVVELRVVHLNTLATSVAMLAFMFTKERNLRPAIVLHSLRRVPRGQRRSFRRAPAEARRLASAWHEVLAALQGLGRFLRSMTAGAASGTPSSLMTKLSTTAVTAAGKMGTKLDR